MNKEVIEELKLQIEQDEEELPFSELWLKYKNSILNLIDKQQKEIEEYKWKPISDYNRKDYDWVLVKYFDEYYDCIPVVAEQRANGKWVTRDEKEIPFDVKYFFDMQQLDKEYKENE